jgi:phosphatidate cytidylyltransferase
MKTLIPRTLTGILYLSVLGFAFFFSNYALFAVFTILMLIAVIEYIKLVHKFPDFASRPPSSFFRIILPIVWIILPVLLLEYWCIKLEAKNIMVALLVILCTNDTLAYIFGSLFGKHKMWQKISPKKSWEGFSGGLICTLTASWFFIKIPYFQNDCFITPCLWTGFAFVVVIAGTCGDFAESMLKRRAQQKDSGIILPGHGGILDRIDSMLFAIPVGFIYWIIVGI